MIALIDYGAGNLTSVRKAFAAIGASVFVPASPGDVEPATAIVVPGVGHFAVTRALVGEWTDAILARLGEASDEAPDCPGFGVLAGRCFRLGRHQGPTPVKVPHVGWNSIEMRRESSMAEGLPPGAQMYFTHSFAAPVTSDTVAVTEHGESFAAVVQHGQVAGVQFHPEKSGEAGLQILRNFVELAK